MSVPKCGVAECTRPCWVDPTTGKRSPACGRSHFQVLQAGAAAPAGAAAAAAAATKVCGVVGCGNPCYPGSSACGMAHLQTLQGRVAPHAAGLARAPTLPLAAAAAAGEMDWSVTVHPKAIRFYKHGPHHSSTGADSNQAHFGNFYPAPIHLIRDMPPFECSEALYQAAKYLNPKEPLSSSHNQTILAWFSRGGFEKLPPDLKKMITMTEEQKSKDFHGELAWQLGRILEKSGRFKPREDWRRNNVQIMRNILILKLHSNPEILEKLKKTEDQTLIERTDRDEFWGDGASRTGQNQLGRLLMGIREESLRTETLEGPDTIEQFFCMAPSTAAPLFPPRSAAAAAAAAPLPPHAVAEAPLFPPRAAAAAAAAPLFPPRAAAAAAAAPLFPPRAAAAAAAAPLFPPRAAAAAAAAPLFPPRAAAAAAAAPLFPPRAAAAAAAAPFPPRAAAAAAAAPFPPRAAAAAAAAAPAEEAQVAQIGLFRPLMALFTLFTLILAYLLGSQNRQGR